jgi:hypothetical protein
MIYDNILEVQNLAYYTQSDTFSASNVLRNYGRYDLDLYSAVIPAKLNGKDIYYVISGSTIKGIIRKKYKELGYDDASLFGSSFGKKENKPAKVIIGWGYVYAKPDVNYKAMIKVNKKLGIVEPMSLLIEEFLSGKMEVHFNVTEVCKITDQEKFKLGEAISRLKYSTIGREGTKGLGLIIGVKIDERLMNHDKK